MFDPDDEVSPSTSFGVRNKTTIAAWDAPALVLDISRVDCASLDEGPLDVFLAFDESVVAPVVPDPEDLVRYADAEDGLERALLATRAAAISRHLVCDDCVTDACGDKEEEADGNSVGSSSGAPVVDVCLELVDVLLPPATQPDRGVVSGYVFSLRFSQQAGATIKLRFASAGDD